MLKHHLVIPIIYLAYVWQAALRPDLNWHGYAPNFLVLALLSALWSFSDSAALVTAGILGLMSDSLTSTQLGNDMLCYVAVALLIQTACPPRLLRHPSLLLVLVLLATVLIDFSTTALRATLNQELPDNGLSELLLQWGLTGLGNGLYTALLAVVPLTAAALWNSRDAQVDRRAVRNSWHRLTS